MSNYGIDVSNYQGEVNWARVAGDGITFAWGKTSEGTSYTDPTFERNLLGARAAGVHFGGYHFARPSANTATREATFFYKTLAIANGTPRPGDCFPVLDLEDGRGDLTVWAGTFLSTLSHLTGVMSVLYTGPWFARSHLRMGSLAGWPLWDSEYGPNDGREHPASVKNVAHQFTSAAVVHGVIGHVDENSAPSLAAILVPTPKPKPKPKPPVKHRLWPVPLPAWFWTWAQWRVNGQTYQRPWDAPTVIPPWAWIRLRALTKGAKP